MPERPIFHRISADSAQCSALARRLQDTSGMLIRAGYQIALECTAETPLMALLSVHPSRQADLRSPAVITSSGSAPLVASIDEFGNVRTRTVAPAGVLKLATDFTIEDSGLPD